VVGFHPTTARYVDLDCTGEDIFETAGYTELRAGIAKSTARVMTLASTVLAINSTSDAHSRVTISSTSGASSRSRSGSRSGISHRLTRRVN
jgi:hypothetical protein